MKSRPVITSYYPSILAIKMVVCKTLDLAPSSIFQSHVLDINILIVIVEIKDDLIVIFNCLDVIDGLH